MDSILVAEDDPVSSVFLEQGLAPLAAVTIAADGPAALDLARRIRFALLVLDARLPKLDGPGVLGALRADHQAASRAAPAIAVSALLDPPTLHRLGTAGFDDALPKPLSLAALQAAARRWLRRPGPPLLADEPALAALGGRPDLLQRMRALFAEELPRTRAGIARAVASGRHDEALDLLHRLRSSCGFCGAPSLQEAAATLEHALRQGLGIERALDRLLAESEHLEAILRAAPGGQGARS
jgi:CheY-like chemotaxis protein/HPt (histidine-containing phosphotransfer) domain-containing protein